MALPVAKRKNIPVDQNKLRRVQKLFNARTATAAVDQALDQVLFGEEVLATLLAAAGKGKGIRDVFGNLR
jgi:hypothetical protein